MELAFCARRKCRTRAAEAASTLAAHAARIIAVHAAKKSVVKVICRKRFVRMTVAVSRPFRSCRTVHQRDRQRGMFVDRIASQNQDVVRRGNPRNLNSLGKIICIVRSGSQVRHANATECL
jgi:hypothetical protein